MGGETLAPLWGLLGLREIPVGASLRRRGPASLPITMRIQSNGNARRAIIAIAALALVQLLPLASSQHREGTLQHAESVADGEAALNKALQSHPDVVDEYFPNKQAVEEYERYRESLPPTEDFVIGILVNPCGANGTHGRDDDVALGYDCCINRFGQGEYAFRPGTRNRFSNGYSNGIPISPDEPLHNII